MSKVTVHMVCSLDGFVADAAGAVAWLECKDVYEDGVDHEDSEAFEESVDCYVIGANTYQQALKLGWPYGDKTTYVLTHQTLSSERPHVHFRAGDLSSLFHKELFPKHQNIWVCGGPMLVAELLKEGLVNELNKTIAPYLLGGGLSFFESGIPSSPLHLKNVRAYKSGFVELHYELRKN